MEFVKAKFSMDSFDDNQPHIDGMTYGNHWNGWACPYFTLENAMRIATLADGFGITYDPQNDKFIGESEYYDREEWESKIIDGVKYYPIGSHSWCWYQMEEGEF